MTDPRYQRTVEQLCQDFGAQAVMLVSWDVWGNPTVAHSASSSIAKESLTARHNLAEDAQYTFLDIV